MNTWFRRQSSGDDRERRRVRDPEPPAETAQPSTTGKLTVPFLPVRCPRCRSADHVKTTGRYSGTAIRYHHCSECDLKFRSQEI